ncbi:ral guanine nucleotide dissociation stimulator-like [Thomomys bottae]
MGSKLCDHSWESLRAAWGPLQAGRLQEGGAQSSTSLLRTDVHSVSQAPAKLSRNKGENDEAPSQGDCCRAGTLEQLVEHLVPAHLTGEHFFIPTFLSTYRKFTSTEQVLDLLFQTAISSILDMWLDEYREDFCQPPHFACLKQLLAQLKRHMTGSHVGSHAQLLLAQMEAQEPSQTQSDGVETGCEGRRKRRDECGPSEGGEGSNIGLVPGRRKTLEYRDCAEKLKMRMCRGIQVGKSKGRGSLFSFQRLRTNPPWRGPCLLLQL